MVSKIGININSFGVTKTESKKIFFNNTLSNQAISGLRKDTVSFSGEQPSELRGEKAFEAVKHSIELYKNMD